MGLSARALIPMMLVIIGLWVMLRVKSAAVAKVTAHGELHVLENSGGKAVAIIMAEGSTTVLSYDIVMTTGKHHGVSDLHVISRAEARSLASKTYCEPANDDNNVHASIITGMDSGQLSKLEHHYDKALSRLIASLGATHSAQERPGSTQKCTLGVSSVIGLMEINSSSTARNTLISVMDRVLDASRSGKVKPLQQLGSILVKLAQAMKYCSRNHNPHDVHVAIRVGDIAAVVRWYLRRGHTTGAELERASIRDKAAADYIGIELKKYTPNCTALERVIVKILEDYAEDMSCVNGSLELSNRLREASSAVREYAASTNNIADTYPALRLSTIAGNVISMIVKAESGESEWPGCTCSAHSNSLA